MIYYLRRIFKMNTIKRCLRPSYHMKRFMSSQPGQPWAPSQKDVIIACVGGVCAAAGIMALKNYLYSSRGEKIKRMKLLQYKGEIIRDKDFGRSMSKVVSRDGKKYYLPDFISLRDLAVIEQFEVKEDDIFVASFPKSGTTWVQEIVYLLQSNMDYKSAQLNKLEARFAYMEYICPGLKKLAEQPSPRLIKTHLPYQFLPLDLIEKKKGKVIYIARNPRDTSVSFYHFIKNFQDIQFRKTFETFFKKFCSGEIFYGPWWTHVKGYMDRRTDENLLLLTYEDLQNDPDKVIKTIADFLGKEVSDGDVVGIKNFCCFPTMKDRPTSNYSWLQDEGLIKNEFMRKGIVGDWENYYTVSMISQLDEICVRELLEDYEMFVYNL